MKDLISLEQYFAHSYSSLCSLLLLLLCCCRRKRENGKLERGAREEERRRRKKDLGSLTLFVSSEASVSPASVPPAAAGWFSSCGWQRPPAGASCNSVLACAFPPSAHPHPYQRWAHKSLAQTWAVAGVCSSSERGTHIVQTRILAGNKLRTTPQHSKTPIPSRKEQGPQTAKWVTHKATHDSSYTYF